MEIQANKKMFSTAFATAIWSKFRKIVLEDMNFSEIKFELRIEKSNF